MRVYIKIDSENRIIAVNSEIFISNNSGWVEIDNGNGDRFTHAQGNYLPMPLTDENGVFRYKFENGGIAERSADEMSADIPTPEISITPEQRLSATENAVEEIINILMEV